MTTQLAEADNRTENSNKGMIEIAQSRQAQEVQAAMILAQRFPRDTITASQRIKDACKRPGLAEAATYTYPRGGTRVTGPSIRLAEALAQNWKNIDFGIIELSQGTNEQGITQSSVMAYAWDLQTNTRQTKVFTVPHMRYTKKGSYQLTDPRDIYEMVANNGARRLRACILGIIPGDITDMAVAECERTLAGNNEKPLQDRILTMVEAFGEFGVTKQMIEDRLGHNLDATSEQEFVTLRGIYTSLKDGMSDRKDHFDLEVKKYDSDTTDDSIAKAIKDKMKEKADKPKSQPE